MGRPCLHCESTTAALRRWPWGNQMVPMTAWQLYNSNGTSEASSYPQTRRAGWKTSSVAHWTLEDPSTQSQSLSIFVLGHAANLTSWCLILYVFLSSHAGELKLPTTQALSKMERLSHCCCVWASERVCHPLSPVRQQWDGEGDRHDDGGAVQVCMGKRSIYSMWCQTISVLLSVHIALCKWATLRQ